MKNKSCDCKEKFQLYARDNNESRQFLSLNKLVGRKLLICINCGKIFEQQNKEVEE